tara:strand:- start:761 stop:967 length:207 start_codon:yes stop_codon:yes gene_type:complete
MVKVLWKEGKKKENVCLNGSKLAYLQGILRLNLTLRRRMYMSMGCTQFVKKQGVQMSMTVGLEELQLS